jgi:hypothetical protein
MEGGVGELRGKGVRKRKERVNKRRGDGMIEGKGRGQEKKEEGCGSYHCLILSLPQK